MVAATNTAERDPGRGPRLVPQGLVAGLRRLPAPVWAMALIYGIGGAMCLFAAAFPISLDRDLRGSVLRAARGTVPVRGARRRLRRRAGAEWVLSLAGRGEVSVSVALIDLDEFKQVNDRRGHAAGDELLVELGAAWRQELRGSEVLARLGGDEFALVLAGTGRDGAGDALRRLRAASPIGWSVGVVEWQRGETLDRAMARADEELYRAKRDLRTALPSRYAHASEPGGARPSLRGAA
jgi:diguanylate cyclase (GGDEF)-like protein